MVIDQIDSYDSNYLPIDAEFTEVGQGFTGDGSKVTGARFRLNRFPSVIAGSVYAAIYAHSGTWGSNGVPSGSPLAISDSVSVDELPTGYYNYEADWVDFTFSGNNQFQTTPGTHYFICLIGEDLQFYGFGEIQVWCTDDSSAFNGGTAVTFNSNYNPEWDLYGGGCVIFQVLGTYPPSTYTVMYSGNGNTSGSAPTDSNSYTFGQSVTVKANTGGLVRTNYTFVGWATISNAQAPEFGVTGSNVNPSSFNMPNSNVTLYAVWQQNPTYTVTYNGNGNTSGTAPTDNNSPYQNNSTVTALGQGSLVKSGYYFLGWATSNSASSPTYTSGSTFTITQNTTLYAVWQQIPPPPTYTATYNGNGNTGGSAPSDGNSPYQSGATVTVLGQGSLTRTNHTFLGWSTSSSATSVTYTQGSTFTIASNTTLYAVWQQTTVFGLIDQINTTSDEPFSSNGNITVGQGFTGNGGKITEARFYISNSGYSNGTMRAAVYAHSGVWGVDGLPTGQPLAVSDDVEVEAGVSDEFEGWIVFSFSGNNQFQTVAGQRYFIVLECDFTGYNSMLVGATSNLSAGNGGTTARYISSWGLVLDRRLLFQLYGDVPTYIVTYSGNGNTGGSVPIDNGGPYAVGSTVTVLGKGNLEKTNSIFLGWATTSNAALAQYAQGSNFTIVGNVVLYAVWGPTSSSMYTVTYNGNGATGGIAE